VIVAHANQGVDIGIVDVTARRRAHVNLQDDVGGVAAREHLNAGVVLRKARHRFIEGVAWAEAGQKGDAALAGYLTLVVLERQGDREGDKHNGRIIE